MNEIQPFSKDTYNLVGDEPRKTIHNFAKEHSKNLAEIGKGLKNVEQKYIEALQNKDYDKVAYLKVKYDSLVKTWSAAMEFVSNSFQLMMNLIRKLSIR